MTSLYKSLELQDWIVRNLKFQLQFKMWKEVGFKEKQYPIKFEPYNLKYIPTRNIYINHFNIYGKKEKEILYSELEDDVSKRYYNIAKGMYELSKYNYFGWEHYMYSGSSDAVHMRNKYKDFFIILKYSPFRVVDIGDGYYMYDCGGFYELLLYLLTDAIGKIPVYITKKIELET